MGWEVKEMLVKRCEREKLRVWRERSILMPMILLSSVKKFINISKSNELLTKSYQFSIFMSRLLNQPPIIPDSYCLANSTLHSTISTKGTFFPLWYLSSFCPLEYFSKCGLRQKKTVVKKLHYLHSNPSPIILTKLPSLFKFQFLHL